MSRIYTSIVTVGDVEIYNVTSSPAGVLQARIGSLAVQSNAGSTAIWQNSDGATSWASIVSATAPSGSINVAASGGDFTTIVAALAAAGPGDTVLVYPGTYTEVNPIVVPDTVSLVSIGGKDGTIIVPNDLTQHTVVPGSDVVFSGFTVNGPTTAGKAAVHLPVGTVNTFTNNLRINVGAIGVLVDSGDKNSAGTSIAFNPSGPGSSAVELTAGSHWILWHPILLDSVVLTNFILADGGIIHVYGGHVDCGNTINAIHVMNGGEVQVSTTHLHSATNGLRIAASGGKIYAWACDIQNSGSWDALVESSLGNLYLGATRIRPDRFSVDPASQVQGVAISDQTGDEGVFSPGQLAIGLHNRGHEMAVGEGDSTVLGMAVLRNTNLEVGAWSDITTEMSSGSGSTADLFSALTVGASVYFISRTDLGNISWNAIAQGIKVLMAGTAINLGTGTLVHEVWTGAAYEVVNVMATDADAPYGQFAQDVFTRVSQSDQMRLGVAVMTGTPTAKIVNGITGLLYRIRVATNAITTSPLVEQIKLHTNRTEINADGFLEFFGVAEPVRTFWSGTGELLSDSSGGANAPNTESITISANVSYEQVKTRYNNGLDERAGTMFRIPIGIDTSRKAVLSIAWSTDGVSTNNINWQVYGVQVREGDVVGVLPQASRPQSVPASSTVNQVQVTEFTFDAPDLVPGDFFAFMIWRRGIADINPDDATIYTISWSGTFWK